MRFRKLIGLVAVVFVVFASVSAVVKFTQTFPKNGNVTVPATNGTMKANCSTLVIETLNPIVQSNLLLVFPVDST